MIIIFSLYNNSNGDKIDYNDKIDSLNIIIENYYVRISNLEEELIVIDDKIEEKDNKINELLYLKNKSDNYEKDIQKIIDSNNDDKLTHLRKFLKRLPKNH